MRLHEPLLRLGHDSGVCQDVLYFPMMLGLEVFWYSRAVNWTREGFNNYNKTIEPYIR